MDIKEKISEIITKVQNDKDFAAKIKKVVEERGARCLGTYGCRGYNTYGPLKLVGGMNKSNPNPEELKAAVEFVKKVEETYE